jgi:hypothetical protein
VTSKTGFGQVKIMKEFAKIGFREIVERGKINTLTHKYMTAHFPGLVHALSKMSQELN